MNILLTTYQDLLDHVIDYLGANATGDAKRDARRAVQAAYRSFQNSHRWIYYFMRGRFNTVAPFSDGTVTYTAATNIVTLIPSTSSGWPVWAQLGTILINNVSYPINAAIDSVTLQLTQMSNPGADVAATTYTLYQETYPLPVDLLATDRVVLLNNAFEMWFEHPSSWMERQRIYHSPATPRTYCIRGAPGYMGAIAISMFPPPDNIYSFDFMYQRRGRPLNIDNYSAGSVSVTNNSTTITGQGTVWTSKMIGSSLRIGADGTNLPTSLAGSYPATYERVIMAVGSDTSLTVDAIIDETATGLKYIISDPADIEEAAMLTCLQRACEFQVAVSRNMKTKGEAEKNYKVALIEAMESDSRSSASDQAGPRRGFPYRLSQMPRGADIS